MKKFFVLGAAVCVAFSMVSCKSNESAYKKAYEKAQQQQQTTTAPAQTAVVPVQTTTTPVQVAPATTTEKTRSEKLNVINGAGLKAYSVVVGAFAVKANAENLQQKLNNAGYSAQIAQNPQGLYRVIAATADDMETAVQSRNALRNEFPDVWLLH